MGRLPYWRLSGFYFFYFAFVGVMAPYWSLYLQSLGLDAFRIGVLMSLLQVMRIFGPNVWGWLADHLGKRVMIVQIAAAVSLASYTGVFFGASFAWLFGVMALMSFFWSASLPLVEATTLSHLGKAIGRYGHIRLWGSVGFIVAVIGAGYILDAVSIGIVRWIVLGLLVGILGFSRLVPEAGAISHDGDHLPVWGIIKRPEVLALIVACFLMAVAHASYYTFYSIYLVEHGYSKSAVGWLWAVGVICEIGVFLAASRLFRSFSLRSVLIVSFGLATLRFLMIGWGVSSPSVLFLAQTLHAFSFGAYHVAAISVFHHFFRGRHQAKGQAIYTSVSFGVGGTLGGIYSGYTWEAYGPAITFTIAAACTLTAMGLLFWKLRLPRL
ncbi:MAG TPA: MFS transporter [Betaproteobacteria bacterium]|nr:MFS transporter [Betaproteobacteria bacterium]